MDKAKQAEVLRKRFKALGGIPYSKTDQSRPGRTKAIPNKGTGKPLAVHYGVSLADKRPVWVGQTETLPAQQLPLKRRRKGQNPLMRIAHLYPLRMPQVAKPKRNRIFHGMNRGLL